MTVHPRQDFEVMDNELWATCSECGGCGEWEEPKPLYDDPHFSVAVTCKACGGSGWECS